MHPNYELADRLSREVIAAGIEVHRIMGPGLLESIYELCLFRELELRSMTATRQQDVSIDYKDLKFVQELRYDVLVEGCILVEVKAVQEVHPIEKAKLLSYMRLLNIPLGFIMNFHELRLIDGLSRMILRDSAT